MEDKTLGLLLDVVGELFSDEISIAVSNTGKNIYTIGQVNELI